jgi:hypothetical protein
MSSLIFVILPLAIYFSLATLPPGRQALIGLGVAIALIALARFIVPEAQGLTRLALTGIAMAAVAQGLRAALGARLPRAMYFALLGLLPLLTLLILTFSIGA